jgi:pimeloyl-ACP methyl ester carboxylesterase
MGEEEDILFQILMWPIFDLFGMAENVFHVSGFEKEASGKDFITFGGRKVGKALVEELVETDMTPFLEAVEAPTLIMHGVQDKISPVEQLEMARTCFQSPRIEITTFHDGGHGLEKPAHRKVMFYHVMQFVEKYT